MNKVYTRINWENEPSVETPLNATNLNNMDLAIDTLDDRVILQDTVKADKTQLSNLVSSWTMDDETGIITITKYNGEQVIFDLNIEKIPVNFVLSSNGILTMTTDDGTEFTADVGSMIPIYTFKDSDTVGFTLSGSADNKVFTFFVKDYSIGESQMDPSYLADIKIESENAKTSAQNSLKSEENSKLSETNARQSELNSKASEENAKLSKINAVASQNNAFISETNARQSELNSKASEENAKLSEGNAEISAKKAKTSEENAIIHEQNSEIYSKKSQSYAIGGTNTRDGEDFDNSKYYSNVSKSYSDTAETHSENAYNIFLEIKEKLGISEFNVNENGYLIYTDNTSYIFTIDENGYLNWEVA